ncbi:MAG: tetratricopeptide repeat protein [Gammaproteobacteria bacterium]|nr:tetratricopeptide repeat protein [Gammaproteobacteria bacterium]
MKNFINIGGTEEEQVDQIKKWLQTNGLQIVFGVVIGLGAIWGWGFYGDYQDQESQNARALYLTYTADASNSAAYDQLLAEYGSSSYADQAMLLMAKQLFNAGEYQSALNLIEPLAASDNSAISSTAILRTATVYFQLGQHESALSTLDSLSDANFLGLVHSMKGDIYLDLANTAEAQKHYRLAIDNITENSTLIQLIQIKLDDLN